MGVGGGAERRRRPSAALAISIAALLVAVAGTAVLARGGKTPPPKVAAYAQIKADGDVVGARSDGVKQADVTSLANGVYCFSGPRGVEGGQVTIDYKGAPSSHTVAQFGLGAGSGCDSGTRFFVSMAEPVGFEESSFFILLYH